MRICCYLDTNALSGEEEKKEKRKKKKRKKEEMRVDRSKSAYKLKRRRREKKNVKRQDSYFKKEKSNESIVNGIPHIDSIRYILNREKKINWNTDVDIFFSKVYEKIQ